MFNRGFPLGASSQAKECLPAQRANNLRLQQCTSTIPSLGGHQILETKLHNGLPSSESCPVPLPSFQPRIGFLAQLLPSSAHLRSLRDRYSGCWSREWSGPVLIHLWWEIRARITDLIMVLTQNSCCIIRNHEKPSRRYNSIQAVDILADG